MTENQAHVELVGGPQDATARTIEVTTDGAPPLGLKHLCMSSLATTLENDGQCLMWEAKYRRRETASPDGVWRYDYDAEASEGRRGVLS